MELSKPIQVIPPGLLGFLQLKNAGQNPRDFPNQLQAILEMRDWYFQALMEDLPLSSVALTNGQTGNTSYTGGAGAIIVPADQWWWVQEYMIQTSGLVATDTTCFGAGWRNLQTGSPAPYLLSPITEVITGTAAVRTIAVSARGFFLPPGAELTVRVCANETAGSITYGAYTRFVRLPI